MTIKTTSGMGIEAFLTKVETCDKSLSSRFEIGVRHPDGSEIVRFLLNGPFCRTTATKKQRQVQIDLDKGNYSDPYVKQVSMSNEEEDESQVAMSDEEISQKKYPRESTDPGKIFLF